MKETRNEWMDEWMNEWMHACMHEWMNERMGGLSPTRQLSDHLVLGESLHHNSALFTRIPPQDA